MRTAFIDVDTQIDFMFPAGALYVPGAETILPNIAVLNRFAGANGIPLISSTDAHAENDIEFRNWPAHCVVGSVGQLKPQSTLLESRTVIPNRRIPDFAIAPQIILEKEKLDIFTNPNFETLLSSLEADRFVVYGVVTEICVKCAAFGLLKRGGGRVEVVSDAVRSLKQSDSDAMLTELQSLGGHLVTTAAITSHRVK